ncbi:ABC transporter ATP-binding protein [Desulfomicrobium baculatum]|uniref:ABC transporter related n=1 Tax=Desulfomicrobium baculatum (strain DSM 4028 / VKM B-1378 / X) TaxID=525897 RepID=C7LP31_DESBD|nr:ABC transporter ATP-binding protein [Desulfomicrobium baculatum]ACU91347.1 ABC transporter related [Desulfomicrobium baculatum DSM 4028]
MAHELSLIQSLRVLLPIVSRRQWMVFWLLLALSLGMAMVELVITALVTMFAAAVSDPANVMTLKPVVLLQSWFGFFPLTDVRQLLFVLLCCILAAILIKNILSLFQIRLTIGFSEGVSNKCRERMLEFYLRAPYLWLQDKGGAELLFGYRVSANLGPALTSGLQLFSTTMMLIVTLTGLIIASPLPMLFFLGILAPCCVLLNKAVGCALDSRSKSVFRVERELHTVQLLSVFGLKEMRLYRREAVLAASYASRLAQWLAARKTQQMLTRLPFSLVEVMGFATLCFIFAVFYFYKNSSLAYLSGIMAFLATAAWRCLPMGSRMLEYLGSLRVSAPYLQQAAQTFSQERSLADELALPIGTTPEPVNFEKEVRFDCVTFFYPKAESPAVEDVSFSIAPKQLVGIVGLSGSGKSTLVNLLTGIIPSTAGNILIDGVPLTNRNRRSWLGKIGYVPQDAYLLDATLAENIALSRWGDPVDRDKVVQCCKMAALDFWDQLENGMDTVLGERGVRLSGGQIQRVAIARALYSDPELIVFDEATSSLDLKNEKTIYETILSLRGKVAMIIVAHRLSTVEGCDRIIWIQNGKKRMEAAPGEVLSEYKKLLDGNPSC